MRLKIKERTFCVRVHAPGILGSGVGIFSCPNKRFISVISLYTHIIANGQNTPHYITLTLVAFPPPPATDVYAVALKRADGKDIRP